MAQFMMILHDNVARFRDVAPEEMQRVIEKYQAWSQRVASSGKLVGGQKLKDEGGRMLTSNGGHTVVRDGPYSEAKEVIGGYFLIDAADYREAVQISESCPHLEFGGRIELREVDPV